MASGRASEYSSASQQARVVTESWVGDNVHCPSCAAPLQHATPGAKVLDFECSGCGAGFELKAKNGRLGSKVSAGAYQAMIDRLTSGEAPHLILCEYTRQDWTVQSVRVIPSYAFTPAAIEKRPPLAATARRAGWVGCNILLGRIPASAHVLVVEGGAFRSQDDIASDWAELSFLGDTRGLERRSWLVEIVRLIEELDSPQFTLADIYAKEPELALMFPENQHVKAKIRQQLQILRDKGYLLFLAPGHYSVVR